jgi:hypothetical protein
MALSEWTVPADRQVKSCESWANRNAANRLSVGRVVERSSWNSQALRKANARRAGELNPLEQRTARPYTRHRTGWPMIGRYCSAQDRGRVGKAKDFQPSNSRRSRKLVPPQRSDGNIHCRNLTDLQTPHERVLSAFGNDRSPRAATPAVAQGQQHNRASKQEVVGQPMSLATVVIANGEICKMVRPRNFATTTMTAYRYLVKVLPERLSVAPQVEPAELSRYGIGAVNDRIGQACPTVTGHQ